MARLLARHSSQKFFESRAEPDSSAVTPDAGSSTGASSTSAGAGWSRRRMGRGLANPNAAYLDDGATLDNLREAVTTLEETERTARRVFGGAHPTTVGIGGALQDARAALRARDTPGST